MKLLMAPWEMRAFDVESYPCSKKRLFVITKAGPNLNQEKLGMIVDDGFGG